jgi:hypothetical protein
VKYFWLRAIPHKSTSQGENASNIRPQHLWIFSLVPILTNLPQYLRTNRKQNKMCAWDVDFNGIALVVISTNSLNN